MIQVSELLDGVQGYVYPDIPLRWPRSVTKAGEEPENKATRDNTRALEWPGRAEVV